MIQTIERNILAIPKIDISQYACEGRVLSDLTGFIVARVHRTSLDRVALGQWGFRDKSRGKLAGKPVRS